MKNVYVGQKDVFYNSECLFVEYNDVLSLPWYVWMMIMKDDQTMNQIFDLDLIQSYTQEEMIEWYMYRKHRNVLKNIPLRENKENKIKEKDLDFFLNNLMDISPYLYTDMFNLNFVTTLRQSILHKNIIHKIIVYSEYGNKYISESIKKRFPGVTFLHGDFREALKNVSSNSTFVFSDIHKIEILKEMGKLRYSSVLMVDGYRYNYTDDDKTKLKIDIDSLMKSDLFKLDFFDNFQIIE